MRRRHAGAIARYGCILLFLTVLYLAAGGRWLPGLLILTVLLPPVSLAGNVLVRRSIRGRITAPTTAVKQTACTCRLELENRSFLPAPEVSLLLSVTNDLTGEESETEILTGLGAKKAVRREFLLESRHCGRIYVQVKAARIADYFGLFSLKVPVKAAARITVLPEMFSCSVNLSPAAADLDESAAAKRGDDRTEVFQLREYQPGDDIRQIHWKLSSKLDTLILRQPGQSVSRSLLVLWDKRHETDPEKMNAMAEVTASVCQALCDAGTAFDLCWTEQEEPEIRLIREEEALLAAIPALVTRAGRGKCPLPDTAEYGQVICITAEAGEPPDRKTVRLLCADSDPGTAGTVVFSPSDYPEKLERLEL